MARPAPELEAPPTLIYAIGRLNQGVRLELRRRLAPWHLSVPELTALSVLKRRPGLSNAQLARRSLITRQSMSEVVASLEARGVVRREADPAHARILRMRLTPAGEALLRHVEPVIERMQDDLLSTLPPEEREIVVRGVTAAMLALSGDQSEGS